jgi:hypothetical protein
MAKQTFAFPASLRTRFLNLKEAPAAYYNHPNNHSRDRCTGPKDLCHEKCPCQPFCGECKKGLCIPQLRCPAAAMGDPARTPGPGPASWNCCSLGGGPKKWQCNLCAATACGAQAGWRCRNL